MKLNIKLLFVAVLALALTLALCACAPVAPPPCTECVDGDGDGVCDVCGGEVIPPSPEPPEDEIPDVSGISLPSRTVTYNGEAHSLSYVGKLPEGVYAIFEGNSKTSAGTYTVNLKFYYSKDGELTEIPDSMLTSTLEITRATYDMSGVSAPKKTVTYDGEAHSITLDGLGTLPTGVSYEIIGDKKKDAGTYSVTVSFSGDARNYEPIDSIETELIILPATVGGISFTGKTVTYNGEAQSIFAVGVPDYVEVTYTGNGVTDAGEYEVIASFDAGDNYHDIPDMKATLVIIPADIDLSGVTVSGTDVSYDGTPKSLTVENVPDAVDYALSLESIGLPGEYEITVTFIPKNTKNYNTPPAMTVKMTISLASDYVTEGLVYQAVDGGYAVVGYDGSASLIVVPATYEGASVVSIASGAFRDNTFVECVILPESVTNIGNSAFEGCTSLARIELPDLTVIGQEAFKNTALTEVTLPDSLAVIGYAAFEGTKLESLTVPFIGGSHHTSNGFLGYIFGATAAGSNSFFVPSTLRSVVISDAAREIPAYAFYGLSGLTEVKLGRTVSAIGISAFAGCVGIEDIYIPMSVKRIDASAIASASPFFGCNEDLMIVFESGSGFGRYYAHIDEDTTALTIYGKTYEDYLVNKDSYRIADLTDATLAGILEDGSLIDGFSPDKTEYTVDVDINKGYGLFSVITSSNAARVTTLEQPSASNGHKLTVTVVSGDESTTVTYTVTFNVTGSFTTAGSVTNKNGTEGTVVYVVDDGYQPTGAYVKSKLEEISNLAVSFAIYTRRFATLKTEVGEDGIERYLKDENGNYVYEITDTQQETINFWRDILTVAKGRSEIVSHTHTHATWGQNDLGGAYIYTNKGAVGIKTAAEGNIEKEFYASKQIITEIFGDDGCMGIAMVTAGITQSGSDYTLTEDYTKAVTNAVVRLAEDAAVNVNDGVITLAGETKLLLNPIEITVTAGTELTTATEVVDGTLPKDTVVTVKNLNVYLPAGTVIPGYNDYYYAMQEDAIENGDLIGSRLTGQVRYTYDDFVSLDTRMKLKGYMITTSSNDLSLVDPWITHIDKALASGGISAFCIHAIVDDATNHSGEGGHVISKGQADKLFAYTESLGDRVWIATLTDAMLYYYEWSTASVSASYEDEKITVTLTDEERDDIYTMPLTVKVTVPGLWSAVTDGESVYEVRTASDGTKYVLVDVAPETTVTLRGV